MTKYLGIDYGSKRVGLAISDETGSIAFPLEVVERKGALGRIAKLVEERRVGAIVIGDTLSHGGAKNPVTPEAEAFANEVAVKTGKSVERVFEVWSSIEASRYAPEGAAHDDSAAAAILLQRYIDFRSDDHSPENE